MAVDLTLLATQLAEASAAYHKLQVGGAVSVFVDQNGERVQYTVGNKSDLFSYIQRLTQQITNGGVITPMQPINFWF